MEPNVILVDTHDREQGHIGKLAAHQQGLLHRAFSIFIVRRTKAGYETLLQKRALSKYHSGGLWTNSCCSHPAPNGDLITQARTRLHEEFGLDMALTDIGQFIYRVDLDNNLVEHELDHVLISIDNGKTPKPNPEEIMDWRWCDLRILAQELQNNAIHYTAWIAPALAIVQSYLSTDVT
jgi:isopentenyl-diphosphate delta-isomerase